MWRRVEVVGDESLSSPESELSGDSLASVGFETASGELGHNIAERPVLIEGNLARLLVDLVVEGQRRAHQHTIASSHQLASSTRLRRSVGSRLHDHGVGQCLGEPGMMTDEKPG